MKKKEQEIDKDGSVVGTQTTTAMNPTCCTCGLPMWATTPNELSCLCWTTTTTYNYTKEPTNTELLNKLSELQQQYDLVWRKLRRLADNIENINNKKVIADIKRIIEK